ncbi:hypothetical protein ACNO7L_08835 [Bisgaard Taxon 45]
MSDNRISELKRVYERCIETRNFEIQQLLQRNNFFIVFQAALFTALSQLDNKSELINTTIFIFGLIVSCFQIGVASGAKFWQEYWEAKLSDIECELKGALKGSKKFICLFSSEDGSNNIDAKKLVESRLNKNPFIHKLILSKFSVSTIPIYMGLVCFFVWIILFLLYLYYIHCSVQ